MTNKLRSFLLAGAASLALSGFTPAHAAIALLNPSDFVFIESPGVYEIINNSAIWYIWAVSVTNPLAGPGASESTSQPNWSSGTTPSPPSFAYNNIAGASDTTTALADDVGPGQTGYFYFTAPPSSTASLDVVTSNGIQGGPFTPTGTIPEPSTWAMLIAGFGFLGWRYGLRQGGLGRLFCAA